MHFSVTTTTIIWRREQVLPLLPLLCSWSFASLSGDDFKSPRRHLCHECFMNNFFFVNCVEQRQRVKSLALHTKKQQPWKLPRAQIPNFNGPTCRPGRCAQFGAFFTGHILSWCFLINAPSVKLLPSCKQPRWAHKKEFPVCPSNKWRTRSSFGLRWKSLKYVLLLSRRGRRENRGKHCSLKPACRARLQSEDCATDLKKEKHVFSLRVTGQSGEDTLGQLVT